MRIRFENKQIYIQHCIHHTVDNIVTVGRGGSIYIPKEIQNFLHFHSLKNLSVYADEEKEMMVLK